MAWRLRLVPVKTNIDFFKLQWVTFGASAVAVIVSLLAVAIMGLNFGVDFKGGTTIRTESTQAVDVGVYRQALSGLELGDVAITQVFDPTFREDQHVAMVRIEAQEGEEAITPETIAAIEGALRAVDPAITFPSVESVGPKVSAELIWAALMAVAAGSLGIWVYVWLRFEWQFAVGTVAATTASQAIPQAMRPVNEKPPGAYSGMIMMKRSRHCIRMIQAEQKMILLLFFTPWKRSGTNMKKNRPKTRKWLR